MDTDILIDNKDGLYGNFRFHFSSSAPANLQQQCAANFLSIMLLTPQTYFLIARVLDYAFGFVLKHVISYKETNISLKHVPYEFCFLA